MAVKNDEFEEFDCFTEQLVSECVQRFCPNCGNPIRLDRNNLEAGRPRTFCTDACRKQFWQAHPRNEAWSCMEQIICPVCGHPFYARREKKRRRIYCSRACANHGRSMKKKGLERCEDHQT